MYSNEATNSTKVIYINEAADSNKVIYSNKATDSNKVIYSNKATDSNKVIFSKKPTDSNKFIYSNKATDSDEEERYSRSSSRNHKRECSSVLLNLDTRWRRLVDSTLPIYSWEKAANALLKRCLCPLLGHTKSKLYEMRKTSTMHQENKK